MFSKRLSIERLWPRGRTTSSLRLRSARGSTRWILRRPVLGVEVRGTSLHLACIYRGLGQTELAGTKVISNFAQFKPEELQVRLREFLAAPKAEEPIVVLGLPRREVIVRPLNLPLVARKSLEEALRLQVEMFQPTDAEGFYWDASLMSKENELAVNLVLAPRASADRLIQIFAQAGYPASHLTVTQFSLLHLYLRSQKQTATDRWILFDCTNSIAEFAALDGEKLVYSRGFEMPAESQSLEHAVVSELRQAISTLHWHEGQPFAFLLPSSIPAPIEQALAKLAPIERLERKLRLEGLNDGTQLEDRLGAIAVAISGVGRHRDSYRLNLLPAELRPVRRRLRHVPTYALLAANAILLVALGLRRPVQDTFLLREYRMEIASLKQQTDEMKGILRENQELQKKLTALEGFEVRGRRPVEALNEVAQRLPQDAWLNVFSSHKRQIELVGSAKSASSLLPLFQASPRFEDVKFNGALTEDSSGRERFRLQVQLKE